MAKQPPLSIEDAAYVLKVSKPTIYKLIDSRELTKPVTRESLRRYIQRLERARREEIEGYYERLENL